MATKSSNCPASECCNGGYVCKGLHKLGLCRSTLVTLALIPFAWEGVVWFADAARALFDLASGVGN